MTLAVGRPGAPVPTRPSATGGPPPPSPGARSAGGASRPWEEGRGAPVGATGEFAGCGGRGRGGGQFKERGGARGPGPLGLGGLVEGTIEAPLAGEPPEGALRRRGGHNGPRDLPVRSMAWGG